jgi:hypothetical protein
VIALQYPIPSDAVNAIQLAGLPTDGVYDAIVKLWLPDHEACHRVYFNRALVPTEILDAAVCCIEGQYDDTTPNGRIPGHWPRF